MAATTYTRLGGNRTGTLVVVDTRRGSHRYVLEPKSPPGTEITVKDGGGMASTNPITIVGVVDGSSLGYTINVNGGSATFFKEGDTGWLLISQAWMSSR